MSGPYAFGDGTQAGERLAVVHRVFAPLTDHILDLGVDHKVIEKSGSWYAVDGERIGQGRETARQFLKDNADIRNEIDSRLRKGLGLPTPDALVEKPKGEKADVLPMPMPEKKKAGRRPVRDEGGPSGPPFPFFVAQALDRMGASAL